MIQRQEPLQAVIYARTATVAQQGRIRAAMYVRTATGAQDGDVGNRLEEQATACRQLARSLGAEIADEYRDVGPGTSSNLPGLQDMLDAARRQEIDVVVCERPDRLARGVAKLNDVEGELSSLGVTVRYATDDPPERCALTAVLARLEAPTPAARKGR
jgi:predicted site-specific integrase-resolvase